MAIVLDGTTGLAGAATGALNGALGATTPSTVVATTVTATTVNGAHNGTLGATTPASVAATTVTASSSGTFGSGSAGTVVLNSDADYASFTLSGGGTNGFLIRNSGGVLKSLMMHNGTGRVNATSTGCSVEGNFDMTGATATKASGTTWANPSDIRLKDNVTEYSKGLAELMQITVKEWIYNGNGGTQKGLKGLGVIADEVMGILPNTVDNYQAKLNESDDVEVDIKKFDATEITWLMLKSIQELNAKFEEYKASHP